MYRLAVGMTNGQIDRLGERLRSSPVVEPADLELLQELRRDYDDAMREAQSRIVEALPEIGTPTARLKTVQTLIGKLRREPKMNLSQMQDIAGLRLVRDLSLRGQTALATSVAELFDNPRTVDRRARPTFGYRAVHVVVRVSGRLVEVQLRDGAPRSMGSNRRAHGGPLGTPDSIWVGAGLPASPYRGDRSFLRGRPRPPT